MACGVSGNVRITPELLQTRKRRLVVTSYGNPWTLHYEAKKIHDFLHQAGFQIGGQLIMADQRLEQDVDGFEVLPVVARSSYHRDEKAPRFSTIDTKFLVRRHQILSHNELLTGICCIPCCLGLDLSMWKQFGDHKWMDKQQVQLMDTILPDVGSMCAILAPKPIACRAQGKVG